MAARIIWLLLLVVLLPAGCGSQGEKNSNKGLDKPQPADKK